MKFEIKGRFNRSTIYTADCKTLAECVVGAIKSGADLSGSNLSGSNLSGSNLSHANLSRADLSHADLSGADLYCANLSGADLSHADLSRAYLSHADLSRADLSRAKNAYLIIEKTQICPQEGAFVGWKKLENNSIAQLVIPHDAKRMNPIGSRKCRASKVVVYAIFGAESGYDKYTRELLYEVGKEIIPDSFNDDLREECSNGIHFFMRRAEAEAY